MTENLTAWPLWQKVLLRFFFVFFSMAILVNAVWIQGFYQWYIQPFQAAATWVGHHFFDLPVVNFDGKGSGDTSGSYLLLLVISFLASIGTAIWSVTDRRKNYDRLFYWLIVILRCYLIAIMMIYGFSKIFKTQFFYPSPERLNETYGQSSPMTLAWTFFGYSGTYNYFMGIAELGCVPLLLFRRTTLLGGLLASVVTANIVAVNYCFDVPVKILSTTLFVMSIVIIAKDAKRLLSFFFLNRVILPENSSPLLFKNKWKTMALISIKYLVLIVLIGGIVFAGLSKDVRKYRIPPDKLLGSYNVIEMNNPQTPKDNTVLLKWDEVTITPDAINVKLSNHEHLNFLYKNEEGNHKLVLFRDKSAKPSGELTYQYIDPNVLILQGNLDNNKINVKLGLNDWENSLLIRRGFHWVNEHPYER